MSAVLFDLQREHFPAGKPAPRCSDCGTKRPFDVFDSGTVTVDGKERVYELCEACANKQWLAGLRSAWEARQSVTP